MGIGLKWSSPCTAIKPSISTFLSLREHALHAVHDRAGYYARLTGTCIGIPQGTSSPACLLIAVRFALCEGSCDLSVFVVSFFLYCNQDETKPQKGEGTFFSTLIPSVFPPKNVDAVVKGLNQSLFCSSFVLFCSVSLLTSLRHSKTDIFCLFVC